MSGAELHVIFGTGPVGQAIARELAARGKAFRFVNRSGSAPKDAPAAPVLPANVWNRDSLQAAVTGATHLYQAAQPAYQEWVEKFVPFQNNIVQAAARVGARLIVVDNLYMYGDGDGKPITETSPLHPLTRKGQARAEAAQAVLDAHQAGHVRAVIGRASDFYGPAVRDSTFGERMFGFAVQGKPADALGNLETPHSVTFIQDFGKGLVILGENESAYGQAWIVPTAPPVSQRQLLEWLFQELDQPYRVRAVGKMMLRVAGLFLPEAKESVEMMYEFEKPFLVDSSKFTRTFGAEPVPLREGVRQTVAWYRRNLGANNGE